MAEKKRYKYICTSTFGAGYTAQELIEWYTGQHFHDILALPGMEGVQFFGEATEQFRAIDRPQPFVVIWDICTDDPHATFDAMRARGLDGTTVFTDAFGDWYDICVQPLSKYVTAEEARGKSVEAVAALARREGA
ncbi:hypothetical protein [Eggerthella sinensis]|uniref:hypothetical protein n=1 Tax=Eggerthella sinensis TaxID=242230 RepID=UPI00266D2218|nr:hypothetical protein [Eggerthella sinensis]